MNENGELSTIERSLLSTEEINIPTRYDAQSVDSNNIEPKDKAAIIMTGVENDIKGVSENVDALTINFENNDENRQAVSSLQSLKQWTPNEIEKSLKAVSRYKKPLKGSTFYASIIQYSGIVQSVDENSFTANLVNIENDNDRLLVEFSFNDYIFGSDKELIRQGASFFWLIGQEIFNGTARNTVKFVFRRTPVVRGKALQEAKDNARELAELFSKIGVQATSEE